MRFNNQFRPIAILPGATHATYDREQEGLRLMETFESRRSASTMKAGDEDDYMRSWFGLYYRQRDLLTIDPAGVAHVHILGAVSKDLPMIYSYTEETDYDDVLEELNCAFEDEAVRAILLRINSPGGCITGLSELAERIAEIRESKPVFAWVDDMACSAAQWIASACSATYCSPSAQVGSIGVILARLDVSKALDEVGIKYELITPEECDLKASFYSTSPLSDEQRADLQASVEKTNIQFRTAIETYRSMKLDPKYARGQVLDADIALEAGLIDAICSPAECYADLLSVAPPLKLAA